MRALRALLLCAAATTSGCALFDSIGLAPVRTDETDVVENPAPEEPSRVTVQYVLVAFEGSPVPTATRTMDEAKRLAERVLAEARRGRAFDELVRLYSDDRTPDGRMTLANWGVATEGDEAERRKMTRGFGNAAFALKVGEIVLVEHDAGANPFGWFVMRRLK